MADRDKPAKIRAAGALLWRPGEQGPEVALIHRPRYDDWSFPKGKALPGEHVLITAVREVREETEVRIALDRRLSAAHYLSGGKPKQVTFARGGAMDPAILPNGDLIFSSPVPTPGELWKMSAPGPPLSVSLPRSPEM